MAYTDKTLLVPQLAQAQPQQTNINPETGMAEGYGTSPSSSWASMLPFLLAGSNRPVKNRQVQVTVPYARPDMIAGRDTIGQATRAYDEALKARETLPYTLASALATVPQQQGYGTWLSDFARGLGTGGTMFTNAQLDRAGKKYANEMKDLAQRLAYDKEMGGTVTTDWNYTPVESDNNQLLLTMLLLGNQGA